MEHPKHPGRSVGLVPRARGRGGGQTVGNLPGRTANGGRHLERLAVAVRTSSNEDICTEQDVFSPCG